MSRPRSPHRPFPIASTSRLSDAPYLNHAVRHHGQHTLIPPENEGRLRRPMRRPRPVSAETRSLTTSRDYVQESHPHRSSANTSLLSVSTPRTHLAVRPTSPIPSRRSRSPHPTRGIGSVASRPTASPSSSSNRTRHPVTLPTRLDHPQSLRSPRRVVRDAEEVTIPDVGPPSFLEALSAPAFTPLTPTRIPPPTLRRSSLQSSSASRPQTERRERPRRRAEPFAEATDALSTVPTILATTHPSRHSTSGFSSTTSLPLLDVRTTLTPSSQPVTQRTPASASPSASALLRGSRSPSYSVHVAHLPPPSHWEEDRVRGLSLEERVRREKERIESEMHPCSLRSPTVAPPSVSEMGHQERERLAPTAVIPPIVDASTDTCTSGSTEEIPSLRSSMTSEDLPIPHNRLGVAPSHPVVRDESRTRSPSPPTPPPKSPSYSRSFFSRASASDAALNRPHHSRSNTAEGLPRVIASKFTLSKSSSRVSLSESSREAHDSTFTAPTSKHATRSQHHVRATCDDGPAASPSSRTGSSRSPLYRSFSLRASMSTPDFFAGSAKLPWKGKGKAHSGTFDVGGVIYGSQPKDDDDDDGEEQGEETDGWEFVDQKDLRAVKQGGKVTPPHVVFRSQNSTPDVRVAGNPDPRIPPSAWRTEFSSDAVGKGSVSSSLSWGAVSAPTTPATEEYPYAQSQDWGWEGGRSGHASGKTTPDGALATTAFLNRSLKKRIVGVTSAPTSSAPVSPESPDLLPPISTSSSATNNNTSKQTNRLSPPYIATPHCATSQSPPRRPTLVTRSSHNSASLAPPLPSIMEMSSPELSGRSLPTSPIVASSASVAFQTVLRTALMSGRDATPSDTGMPLPYPVQQRLQAEWSTSTVTSSNPSEDRFGSGPEVIIPIITSPRNLSSATRTSSSTSTSSSSSAHSSRSRPFAAPMMSIPSVEESDTASLLNRLSDYTDLDLLIARLDSEDPYEGGDYETLTMLSEFLGTGNREALITDDQFDALVLRGPVEILRRRATPDGRVKIKLSVLGLPVDRCVVCLNQFRENDPGAVLQCQHAFHEGCCRRWLRTSRTCPTCRAPVGVGDQA